MMDCLLNNKVFSNQGIKEVLLSYGLKKEKISEFLDIYRKIREDKEVNVEIKKEDILALIKIVKNYSKRIENEAKKKAKKRN